MTVKSNKLAGIMAAREELESGEIASASSDNSVASTLSSEPLTTAEKDNIRKLMLERLSMTKAHFAHRQRDEPDLTQQEKVDIAADLLQTNPTTFLARFGRYLHSSDLPFFQYNPTDEDQDCDYEVQFYLKEIVHRCSHSNTIVKNRRFAAMQELEAAGVYFSENEMKSREPLLYEQMVGQYLTEEEKQQQAQSTIDRSDLRFSTIMMNFMDLAEEKAIYDFQKEKEECQQEEEEEEDEEEDSDEEDKQVSNKKKEKEDDDDDLTEDPPEISDVRATSIWRQQQREEFKAIMHEKFLSGNDSQFDYSQVDNNPDYDSLALASQEEEQKYFLAEDPQTMKDAENSDSNMDTNNDSSVKMEEGGGEEEVEDYMAYEPSSELVAKSAQFARLGSWDEEKDT